MNSTEIILLALSLYGHDWGMAVSKDEMDCISQAKSNCGAFVLLKKENDLFKKFLIELGVDKKHLTQSIWQEYVRKTHAIRSGERIIKYFESIDSGIGEAVARISEGHWLDIKELMDYSKYPTNFSVLGETVNLKAIAIYLRLIDLFDIGNDRTPYVIWKYVSPRNSTSKMEWAKHRALQPITCPTYQDGRIILVDGSTDDHNVFAALLDLKNYCSEQLKACSDLLAQINDPYHKLNIYHIEWRVKPRNFKPINIQFEFDRLKMFDVLSDDIYKGNIYVFLRELLQNSIDAIKTRREILEKKNLFSSRIGKIEIKIIHKENGDAEIIFKDDGVGMDEYIIKNYLSVVGRSYYTSSDFEKLGLKMDPISRFGVGILSCFMVSDEISIETFRDPYISGSNNEKLRIDIPTVNKQFRIESLDPNSAEVGTKITINVLGRKIFKNHSVTIKNRLNVTEYLKRIAGFVEYPIIIEEDTSKLIIIHPYRNIKEFDYLDKPTSIFHQLDLTFPFGDAFLAHSISEAKEYLKEVVVDIKEDLKINDLEGNLVFLHPKKEKNFFKRTHSYPIEEYLLLDENKNRIASFKTTTVWENGNDYGNQEEVLVNIPKNKYPQIKVFADGILVEEAAFELSNRRSYLFNPEYNSSERAINHFVLINITKKAFGNLDLSRSRIISKDKKIITIVEEIFEKYLFNKYYKPNPKTTKLKNLISLALICSNFNLPAFKILKLMPNENYLLGFVKNEGKIKIEELDNLKDVELNSIPRNCDFVFSKIISNLIFLKKKFGIEKFWNGGDVVINDYLYSEYDLLIARKISGIFEFSITENFYINNVRFVSPPFKMIPPLASLGFRQKTLSKINQKEIFEKIIAKYDSLEIEELHAVIKFIEEKFEDTYTFIGAHFAKPFENKIGYDFILLNLSNTTVLKFIASVVSYLTKIDIVEDFSVEKSLLKDKLMQLPFFQYEGRFEGGFKDLNKVLEEIGILLERLSICENYFRKIKIGKNDFVDKAIKVNSNQLNNFWTHESKEQVFKYKNPILFGKQIK